MDNKKVFKNTTWLVACKIAQSIMQLIIGMITARYLGPSNYGLINYASSIVAFAVPVMQLGLRATLVHELVQNPEKEGEIIGTSMVMNILSSCACIIGVFCFVSVVDAGQSETIAVCILYSLSLFFAAIEMIQYWFQYKLESKYVSITMLCVYVVVSAYKIFLLVTQKSIYWFAVSHSIEYGLIGITLIFIYKKLNGKSLSFSYKLSIEMINRSKYYILSAMMVVIIQNTDHIMITSMLGTEENGFYSAAITCAGVAQFVYAAIIDSFRPVILSAKKTSKDKFEKNLSFLYGIIIYMSIAQGIVYTIFAKLIVVILYGSEYIATVPILRVLVWYIVFSMIGTVRNIWILAEGKQNMLPIINMFGALSNVVLNYILIPKLGALGAAIASFTTQMLTNFVLGFIFKPIRYNNVLMLRGINPKFTVGEGKKFFMS